MSPRYKITYEYIGKVFTGWQKLKYNVEKLPIQQVLENSLEKIYRYKIPVVGSSRTDRNVSAVGQVSHFDVNKRESKSGVPMPLLSPEELTLAMNYNFGRQYENNIRIIKTEIVGDRFHSRFNATSRTYIYKILSNCGKKQIPLELQDKVYAIESKLNLDKMREASNIFIGTHDFSSFRSSKCSSKRPIRSVAHVKIYNLPLPDIFYYNPKFMNYSRSTTGPPIGDNNNSEKLKELIDGESNQETVKVDNKNNYNEDDNLQYFGIEIKARAFLHNQVRIMVSSLVEVGKGNLTVKELEEIKEKKSRLAAPSTAPGEPLTLLTVSYDDPKVILKPTYNSNNNNDNSSNITEIEEFNNEEDDEEEIDEDGDEEKRI